MVEDGLWPIARVRWRAVKLTSTTKHHCSSDSNLEALGTGGFGHYEKTPVMASSVAAPTVRPRKRLRP